MCVDFTDLNKACTKNSFSLPTIDRPVDTFSIYNQIFMNPLDKEKTTFTTKHGDLLL